MSRRSVSDSANHSKNRLVVPVSVVGLSSDECDDGCGVGKSSFCSRFVRPAYDDYEAVKGSLLSCISESDFAHPVINNVHFLYYPAVGYSLDCTGRSDAISAEEVTFHVIEQTVFTNDATFRPFLGSGSYVDRATQQHLRSEGKLAYTSRDAIGDDSKEAIEFPCELFRRTGVKGFICVYDLTVKDLRKQDQEKVVCHLIKRIKSKVKVPVVLAVLKCDVLQIREPENESNIAQAREIAKRFSVPLIFASAHKNVNVKQTFLTLAKLVLGKKLKGLQQMSVEYEETDRDHLHISRQIEKDYGILLSSMVKNLHATWSSLSPKLEGRVAFENFIHIFGKGQAKKDFMLRVLQIAVDECNKGVKDSDNPSDKNLRAEAQEALRHMLQEHEDFQEVGDLHYEFVAFTGDASPRSMSNDVRPYTYSKSNDYDYESVPVERIRTLSQVTSARDQSCVSATSKPTQEDSDGNCDGKQLVDCLFWGKSEERPCGDWEDDYEEVVADDENFYENV